VRLNDVKLFWFKAFAVFRMLYAFFCVILRLLNFICRRFGTLWSMEQSVPKSRHIKFRRREITQKKAYNKVKIFIGNYCTTICRKQIVISCLFHRYFRLSRYCRNLPFLLGFCATCFSNIWTTFRADCYFHSQRSNRNLTFRGPCIVIYSYNKSNEMH